MLSGEFHLEGYEVSQYGTHIVLRLQRDASAEGGAGLEVRFADVTLYHFTHTTGALLTHIGECTIPDLLAEIGSRVAGWSQSSGIALWSNSLGGYRAALLAQGYRAWRIESAIGFSGFVIARSVSGPDE
jgi:hypothetical protein